MSKKIMVTSSTTSTIYEEMLNVLEDSEMAEDLAEMLAGTGELPLDDIEIIGEVETCLSHRMGNGIQIVEIADDVDYIYHYNEVLGCSGDAGDLVENYLILGKNLRVVDLADTDSYRDIVVPVVFAD